MSEATSQILLRAYELIEADKQDEARDLLEPVVESEKDNADAWWLYIHAVDSSEEAQHAIQHLTKIAPNYPGVQELKDKMAADDFLGQGMPVVSTGRGNNVLRLLGLVVIVIVILLALVLLTRNGSNTNDDQSPSNVQSQQSVQTEVHEETAGAGTTTSDTGLDPVMAAFSAFDLADPAVTELDSEQGKTRLVNICSADAPRNTLDAAMLQISSVSDENSDVDTLGIRVWDCSTDAILNTIVVHQADAARFDAGQIDETTYRSLWRVPS